MTLKRTAVSSPHLDALRDILEIYASKADELIAEAPNRAEKNLHLDNAERIREAREGLRQGRLQRFVSLAVSKRMLPVTRRVARHTSAFNHLERLPRSVGLEFCDAFRRALVAEKRAETELTKSGKLKREPGIYTGLDLNVAKLRKVRAVLEAGKAL